MESVEDAEVTEESEHEKPQPIPSTNSEPSQPTRQSASGRGGIRTLQDLGGGQDHHDDDSESDNDYFTGGEKSGLAVHGGGGNRDPEDLVQKLLDRAKKLGSPLELK